MKYKILFYIFLFSIFDFKIFICMENYNKNMNNLTLLKNKIIIQKNKIKDFIFSKILDPSFDLIDKIFLNSNFKKKFEDLKKIQF